MNVKPGDAALIVMGRKKNLGRLVLVTSEFGDVDYSYLGYGVLPCWNVESLGGMLDTPGGPAMQGFIPDLALRPLFRGFGTVAPSQQLPLNLGEYPVTVLASRDMMTEWIAETSIIDNHPLVKMLDLKQGVDFLPGDGRWTLEGDCKVAAAYNDPPTLEVAAWFREANVRALAEWEADQMLD